MSGIDYRALCAELLADYEEHLYRSVLADRARTALAQPEPEAVGLSLEEVEDLCEEHCFNVEGYESIECLQGLINDALARWGRPAPAPAGGEVAELVAWLHGQDGGIGRRALYSRIADLLSQRHPSPVPVSERLPGPEDCDGEGRCWWLHVGEDGVGDWFQRAPYPSVTSYAFFRMTHWLPATALPLPAGEVQP